MDKLRCCIQKAVIVSDADKVEDNTHMIFLFTALESSVFSKVECRAEELLDRCVSASLSVLDTDHRGASLSPSPLCCQCQSA